MIVHAGLGHLDRLQLECSPCVEEASCEGIMEQSRSTAHSIHVLEALQGLFEAHNSADVWML